LFELEFCTIIRGAELDSVFSRDIVNELAVSEGTLLGSSKSKFTNSPRRIRSKTADGMAGMDWFEGDGTAAERNGGFSVSFIISMGGTVC